MGAQVVHPLGVRPPRRANDHLSGLAVEPQRHRDRLAALACLPTLVRDQQKRVAEQPATAAVVERARQPHEREREPAGLPSKPEQPPPPVGVWRGCRGHAFVTGGLKIRDSYAWVTAAMCCETCATIDPAGFTVANIGMEIRTLPISGRLSPSWRYCG